jgi:succinyl-CoA synthetase alpha subunit
MAILVDSETRLVVQGLTGREGSFHAQRNKDYGTNLVAGVTPGKGGGDVNGTPVFDTVREAVQQTGANTSLIFVPARFACDAVLEAYDAGVGVIVAITENIPAMDMARAVPYLAHAPRKVALIGPNCPGLISPGQANVGIIPGEICKRGPVGLVSRSGTLTYQIIHELTQRGIGQSTCVGIGGDPIPGSDFIDVLARFEADPETELVVLVGEIGGDAEERAAAWAKENMSKPVVAYIAGLTAPPGKRMGHAGAIISGSKGTAAAKIEALQAAGIEVGANPTEVAEIVARVEGLAR